MLIYKPAVEGIFHAFIIYLYDLTLPPNCSNVHACKHELARAAISVRFCKREGVLRHLEKYFSLSLSLLLQGRNFGTRFIRGRKSINVTQKNILFPDDPDKKMFYMLWKTDDQPEEMRRIQVHF